MKIFRFITTLGLAFSLGLSPLYADSSKGQRIFRLSCASCHGKQGEKKAVDQSELINRLQSDEIITALKARKRGEIKGAGNKVKERLSEKDMQDVAEFIQTLGR
ncbi:c-type cytochrome [Mesocricetibacter intestinalis]|uniref:c-type cytochrome n=1 Tax=Mesocricetibacter intestinalis TaxID=1521930 RepID=UPI0010607304|nr:c-type cytochrome [Mesocricetibacter intestinalis]